MRIVQRVLIAALMLHLAGCTTHYALAPGAAGDGSRSESQTVESILRQTRGSLLTINFRSGLHRQGQLVLASADSLVWIESADRSLHSAASASIERITYSSSVAGAWEGGTIGLLGAALPLGFIELERHRVSLGSTLLGGTLGALCGAVIGSAIGHEFEIEFDSVRVSRRPEYP